MPTKKSTQKSIPEKLDQLHALTDWFYSDDFALDQAAAKYKEALKLTDEIDNDLDQLKNEINQIDQDFSQDPDLDPDDNTDGIPY